jgi:undecaprenyl-diphosphatase
MQHDERWHDGWLAAATVRRWVAAREFVTLLLVAALAGGVFAFIEIADAVREEETRARRGDPPAMRRPGIRPIRSARLIEEADATSPLGGVTIIGLVTMAVAATFGPSASGGLRRPARGPPGALLFALKRGFDRPRRSPHETTARRAS